MTAATIDRLPLGVGRHVSADVTKYPGVDIRNAGIMCGYLVRVGGTVGPFNTGIVADAEAAGWPLSAPGLSESVAAPVHESELR